MTPQTILAAKTVADRLDAYSQSLRFVLETIFPGPAAKRLADADHAAAVAALDLLPGYPMAATQREILTATTRTAATPDELDGWVARWRALGDHP